jgi:hypothetical protein
VERFFHTTIFYPRGILGKNSILKIEKTQLGRDSQKWFFVTPFFNAQVGVSMGSLISDTDAPTLIF